MKEQSTLLSGLQSYQNRDYITALKHFGSNEQKAGSLFQTLSSQALTAVTNLQLCNYNQAGQQLSNIYSEIVQAEGRVAGTESVEMIALKAKVLCNLMILELLSCGDKARQMLEEIVQTIRQLIGRDRSSGVALFRLVIRSMFGFESFAQMESQCEGLAKKISKNQPKSKANAARQYPSAMLLSSFSLYSHLSGNYKQAYLLEQSAYQISKQKQVIQSILSLRHLQELAKELKDQKAARQYRNQLIVAMSGEQLEGVAQQTLFRNYKKKMELACLIVAELIQKEQQWCRDDVANGIEKSAVLWKLKSLQKQEKNDQISIVLNLLESNQNILKILHTSSFVKQATNQYLKALKLLADDISKIGKRIYFKQMIQNISAEISRNILEQRSIESPETNKQDLSFRSNASQKHKHPYATSFYLPKRDKSQQREEESFDEVPEPQETSRSRLTTQHHFANKVYLRPHPAKFEEEKANSVYKIAKGDQRPAKKIEPKEGKLDKEAAKSKSRSKVEGDLISKQKKREVSATFGQSVIGQFIKQEVVPTQPVQIPHQVLPAQTSKLPVNQPPLQKQALPRETLISKSLARQQAQEVQKSKLPQSKLGFNIIKEKQEPEQIAAIGKKYPVKPSQIEQSQAYRFNPTKTTPLGISPKEPTEDSRHITTLSQLRLKHGQPLHRSTISRQQFLLKLRRMISLCQSGQYIQKKHFSSDGGAQRFLMLSKSRDKIFWGESEEAIDISSSSSSYSMQDIKGIVYGKVTDTMRKQCNHKLDAWKCFSLILKKRTFDVFLDQERDLFFWLPGLSLCLKDLDYSSSKYRVPLKHGKSQKMAANVVVFGDRKVERYYSVGRILWKRFLIRIKSEYLVYKKHEKYHKFSCPNAYAVVIAAVRTMGYKTQVMKKHVS